MAEQNSVQVIEKNEGTKIPYNQDGYSLELDDGALTLKLTKYQKDWPVLVDVCRDKNSNLTISTDNGLRYVAQIVIPAIQYNETVEGEGEERTTTKEAIPLDTGDVVLTLWSVD